MDHNKIIFELVNDVFSLQQKKDNGLWAVSALYKCIIKS